MTFDFTFFIIIRRRAIIECALVISFTLPQMLQVMSSKYTTLMNMNIAIMKQYASISSNIIGLLIFYLVQGLLQPSVILNNLLQQTIRYCAIFIFTLY